MMPDAPTNIVTLDVRDDIRDGREPFRRIMDAVGRLRDGEALRVIAPFEPRPLINFLGTQGFTATVASLADGSFEVVFSALTQPDADNGLLA